MKKKAEENLQFKPPVKKPPEDYYTALWRRYKAKPAKVSVRVKRKSAILGEGIILQVQVYSGRKPGRIKQGERFFYKNDPIKDVRQMAGVLAGALAERCCEEYLDSFDPSECARQAMDTFDRLREDLDRNRLTTAFLKE